MNDSLGDCPASEIAETQDDNCHCRVFATMPDADFVDTLRRPAE